MHRSRPVPAPRFPSPLPLSLLALALWSAAPAPPALAAPSPADQARAQLSFGIDMARRGLWREALFRFQEAERLNPDHPGVLNNMAVAFEATGEFEKALDYYQRALKVSPSKRDLRNNYARFVEFYQSYRGEKKPRKDAPQTAAREDRMPPIPPPNPVGADNPPIPLPIDRPPMEGDRRGQIRPPV